MLFLNCCPISHFGHQPCSHNYTHHFMSCMLTSDHPNCNTCRSIMFKSAMYSLFFFQVCLLVNYVDGIRSGLDFEAALDDPEYLSCTTSRQVQLRHYSVPRIVLGSCISCRYWTIAVCILRNKRVGVACY